MLWPFVSLSEKRVGEEETVILLSFLKLSV